MSRLAIIPAREGSKRIPFKNIKRFLGKPIIAYSIETAIESGLFDEVMVSTDSENIASIAQKYGAKVPFLRSKKNSGDYSRTIDALIEVLENYKCTGKEFEEVCCIHATAPLIRIEHLKRGLYTLIKEDKDSTFPVVSFNYPVWRGLALNENDDVEMIWPEYQKSRSQDLQPVYHDSGQWYWFKPESIVEKGAIFTDNSASIVLSKMDVQDIDDKADWEIAELKYLANFKKEKLLSL